MFMWIDEAAVIAPLAATAIIISAASVTPRPLPPYSVGSVMPSQPPSAMVLTNSTGNAPVWSALAQ